ncbi:MAG: response regulator, partial [Ignavibacteriaceae bacterium]
MKINVLLVDDEKDFVEALAERLQLRDFNVTIAFSGDEAIKLVEENGFDVIVLDVQMPGKNGVETLKEIKNIEQLSQ